MSERTHYVNVDLDLTGDESMQPLLDAWKDAVVVLHQDHHFEQGWTVGLETSPELDTADATVRAFVALVRGLSPELRARWDRLRTRDLDIGIQAGTEPRYWRHALEPETLAGVAEIGARLVCTVYAPVHEQGEPPDDA